MAKFRVRFLTVVDKTIEAFDLDSASRQAKFIAGGLKIADSDGEFHPAMLYSVEETKDDNGKDPVYDPLGPKPQRQFAA